MGEGLKRAIVAARSTQKPRKNNRTRFILTTKGDPELGDNGQTAEVKTWVAPGQLDTTKAVLRVVFAQLWKDANVTIEIAP